MHNRFTGLAFIAFGALIITSTAVFLFKFSFHIYIQTITLCVIWFLYGGACWVIGNNKALLRKYFKFNNKHVYTNGIISVILSGGIPPSFQELNKVSIVTCVFFWFVAFLYGSAWFIVGNEKLKTLGELVTKWDNTKTF